MATSNNTAFPESLIPVAEEADLHHLALEERIDRLIENINRATVCNIISEANYGRRARIIRELRDEQYLILHITLSDVPAGHLQAPEVNGPVPDHEFVVMKITLLPMFREPVDAIIHEIQTIKSTDVPVPFIVKAGSAMLLDDSDKPIPYIVLAHGNGRPLTIGKLRSMDSHEVRNIITQLVDTFRRISALQQTDVNDFFNITSDSSHAPFRHLSDRPNVCAEIFRRRQISQALSSLSEPVAVTSWFFDDTYNDVVQTDMMLKYMADFSLSDQELGLCLPKLDLHNIFVDNNNEITALSGWDAAFCGLRELMVPPRWLFDPRGPEEWRNILRQAVLDISHELTGAEIFESWYLAGPENQLDEIDDDAVTYRFAIADAIRRPYLGLIWPKWDQHPMIRVTIGQPAGPIRAAIKIVHELHQFLKKHGLLQVVADRQARRIAAAKAYASARPARSDAPGYPSGNPFGDVLVVRTRSNSVIRLCR